MIDSPSIRTATELGKLLVSELALTQVGSDINQLPVYNVLLDLQEQAELDPAWQGGLQLYAGEWEAQVLTQKPTESALRAELELWAQALAQGESPPALTRTVSQVATTTVEEKVPDLIYLADSKRPKLFTEFMQEARQHLDSIETVVERGREGALVAGQVSELFRALHSLKGISGFHQMLALQKAAHRLEDYYESVRHQPAAWHGGHERTARFFVEETRRLLSSMETALGLGQTHEPIPYPFSLLLDKMAEPPPLASAPRMSTATGAIPKQTMAIPVIGLDRAERLLDLIGQLANDHANLAVYPELLNSRDARLKRQWQHMDQTTKELLKTAVGLRAVPLRALFTKMQRLVRDLATELEKEMELHFSGEQLEVDRQTADRLADPLMHMIRNACDHGIESLAVRLQLGKPLPAQIHLSARLADGQLLIQLRDDGRGLQRDKILRKAVEKNLLSRPAEDLADGEVWSLIFHPGFSTAEQVTGISGRGVGMDVVQHNVQQLGGTIQIQSQPGAGTEFHLALPASPYVGQGCLFRVADRHYLAESAALSSIVPGSQWESSYLANRLAPLWLQQWLAPEQNQPPMARCTVLLLKNGEEIIPLVADQLVEEQTIFYRATSKAMMKHRLLKGVAMTESGRPAFLLDTAALAQMAHAEKNPEVLVIN